MNTVQVTRDVLAQTIMEFNGSTFFTVTFIKRTNGEIRIMNCRKGVHKYTNGGELKYDPRSKGLVNVWDAQVEDPAKAYRMISLDSLISATISGVKYEVATA